MNFLVDAQLPRWLVQLLQKAGHDAFHTLDLPGGNRTSDRDINDISVRDQRVVITKDADFVNSFLVKKQPYKLLLISTGNITNAELKVLFQTYLPTISLEFASHGYLELSRIGLIAHL